MAYLDDNPPVRSQFRCPRRADPSGVVVVHTAESTPDFVGTDGGAEAVARFIRDRTDPGSYHDIADSDSFVQLVRYDCEAFHDATGSNPHSYGVSAATRADVWPLAPQAWRDGCVRNMAACAARYATWLAARRGIVIPARRISRDESELRIPGFISHAERDPARRTDPGRDFPWDAFLAEYARLTALSPAPAVLGGFNVMDLARQPTSGWVNLVIVGQDHQAYHYTAPNVEGLASAPKEPLGGQVKAVTCNWSGDTFIVIGQGLDDDRMYTKYWRADVWSGWFVAPEDGLVLSAAGQPES